ncbi:MAG: pirin family protein [Oscillatoriales cyanobacterium C42_A2020_001]|nr:pirin family protein [Leptolyngbyaceae cyanobacterium C42_A2020_001]
MITIRRSQERGHANHGWLNSYHTFSFANYYDPDHIHFRDLRVINEDRVAPGGGFPTHPHRDMEILSYVISGALAHRDSLGNVETVGSQNGSRGVQRFSAGTGIAHSEFNPSDAETVHFLQIWLFPEAKGLTPSYEQKVFSLEAQQGEWVKLASRNASDGSVTIHQDVEIFTTLLDVGEKRVYELGRDRHAWLQVVRGEVVLNGHTLQAGDGAAVSEEQKLILEANTAAEVVLFDLA